ncbi:hypothetical protein PV328_006766 [Microctonus aethiopoides]|uniref:Uncharacterized protein n=1 Tax=Microctonus aethiopoides TaxID=144406 RepID=A0AA39FQ53_9HYME|nr:hypothetical protein PV328_006766 [Microctonus aethiopoides]
MILARREKVRLEGKARPKGEMVITLCVLQLCIRFAHHEERNKTGVWSVPVVCTYNPTNTSCGCQCNGKDDEEEGIIC